MRGKAAARQPRCSTGIMARFCKHLAAVSIQQHCSYLRVCRVALQARSCRSVATSCRNVLLEVRTRRGTTRTTCSAGAVPVFVIAHGHGVGQHEAAQRSDTRLCQCWCHIGE